MAERKQLEHFALAFAERVVEVLCGAGLELAEVIFEQQPRGGRIEKGAAFGDGADGVHQLGVDGRFKHITSRAGLEHRKEVTLLGVDGEDEDLTAGKLGADATRGLQPVHFRHGDVHDNDVGAESLGLFDGFQSIAGLAYDLDVGLVFDERGKADAHHHVIVYKQDADGGHGSPPCQDGGRGALARMEAPSPAQDSTASSPPMMPSRSRMPIRPRLCRFCSRTASGSKPQPSSRT